MLVLIVSFIFLLIIVPAISVVPGTIRVTLLSDNQVSNKTYAPSSTVRYAIEFEDVPMDDNVQIGVEIRGSNPAGGPRGYITTARKASSIKDFVEETNNLLEFQLTPNEVYAGYTWFFRPYVFFANESLFSSNFMNSGASESFHVLKE